MVLTYLYLSNIINAGLLLVQCGISLVSKGSEYFTTDSNYSQQSNAYHNFTESKVICFYEKDR